MKPALWVQSNHIDLVRQTGVHMIRASNDQHDTDYVPLYDSEEIERLRGLLREALPELRGELWQESANCGSCYQYGGHRPDCLVKRIEEVLE